MKLISYTISVIFIAAVCPAVFAVDYQIPLAQTPPVMDANSVAGEWDGALTVNVSYPEILSSGGSDLGGGAPSHSDLSAEIKMLWDSDNLYMYVRMYDDNLDFNDAYPGPYNSQDCFQMLFNPLNDQSSVLFEEAGIYDIAPDTSDGAGASAYKHDPGIYGVNNFQLASKQLADGWQMEIAVPFYDTFKHYARPGDRHGFGILLVDFDGGSSAENFLADFGDGSNTITDISTWNTITLIGENGCGVNGRFAGDLNGDCYVNLDDFAFIASQWLGETL